MTVQEITEILACGEDSKHQFKEDINNIDSLASEMVAFLNTDGGIIIVGIDDKTHTPKSLTSDSVSRINQLISNAASQSIKPPINPITENILYCESLIMLIYIPKGINKSYMDNKGSIWVKSGSDKRKVTSREEIQRMFQSSGLMHGDEVPVDNCSIEQIDQQLFYSFYKKEFEEDFLPEENSLATILENMNLVKNGNLNVAGALLFGRNTKYHLPIFIIKAISYPGKEIDIDDYIDSRDISGNLSDVFQHTISFAIMNTRHEQKNQSVNSLGIPQIPKIVYEELIANALIHRDYFISAPIRLFMFCDRVEIISPGHLPNNLTIENIKSGNSNIRNPILASFATKLLPYRGLGSGIRRALKAYPEIEFIDDRDSNLFKVIIRR